MKIVKPTFYKNFKCIAGDCPDPSCQGSAVHPHRDSLEYYETLDNSLEIKKRIDSVLSKDEFDNTIFTLAPKKRCPFLNDENLCDMHIAIGGEHTPYTCRTFPRFIYDFGATREIGISFSCPVASDMMYNTESFDFETEVNSDLPTLNDIDAEKYFLLYKGRAEAYKIAKDKSKSIRERLNDLLDLGVLLQEKLFPYDEGGDDIAFFDVFKNPELINPEWKEKVENFSLKQVSDTQSNENILMYFLYKYLMQAVYDDDALSKIKMAVLGVLINTYFGEDSWTVHLWSKETEHSQYNMDRYKKLLKSADCLSVAELKNRI